MVERLKAAIEKAREQRAAGGAAPPPAPHATPPRRSTGPGPDWTAFPEAEIDRDRMRRERLISFEKSDAAHAAFDILRTRTLKVFRDRGWSRLGVTSPTKGCGKSVTAANLAISLAREPERRVLLMDFDFRRPTLARYFGAPKAAGCASLLTGEIEPERALRRIGDNLLIGFGDHSLSNAAEIMQSGRAQKALASLLAALAPTIVIYDLPPILGGDDALGFSANVDAMLLIAAAGQTKAAQIEQCERLMSETTEFLGVVLNKCREPGDAAAYGYDYSA